MLRLDRNAECEADLLGIQYLYLAGYDPRVFDDVLERLLGYEKRSRLIARLFTDHPASRNRISKLQNVIEELPDTRDSYVLNTSDFDEFKTKLEWDLNHTKR